MQHVERPAILLSADECAEVMAVDRGTLDHWRRAGLGPRPVTTHPRLSYDLADVQRFLAEQPEQQQHPA